MSNQQQRRSATVSRRGFLRGAGGFALTLPWMESLPVAADQAVVSADRPPVRLGCLFFSNGVEPAHWWARGAGATMELGEALSPLSPFTEEIVFLRGLFNEQAVRHSSAHLGRMPNLLSGAWVSTDQSEIRVGKTMDQVLAERIGTRTAIPSLVIGVEPTELRLEDGLSMIYGSCISWESDTKPAMKEIYPSRVYDLLVGDSGGRQRDLSVLDQVLGDAHDLEGRISSSDRVKLDEFMESIRDIEQRITRASQDGRLEGWSPSLTEPNIPRPDSQLPQDVPEHMRLMMDLIVLAFQMDKTRIATCMLNNDLSQMNFGFLEGVQGSLHLDLTHNGRDPELEAMYLKTNQFHLQQFAYLLERMQSVQEGDGTLLDNSLLLCCSNLLNGDTHQADEMPFVLAGRGGGSLQTGRILDVLHETDENRRACSLYLSLMNRMGASLTAFGDADRELAGL